MEERDDEGEDSVRGEHPGQGGALLVDVGDDIGVGEADAFDEAGGAGGEADEGDAAGGRWEGSRASEGRGGGVADDGLDGEGAG